MAWIPGIFLAEAVLFVGMGIATYEPVLTIHVHQQEAVVFRVKDTDESDSARGDYDGTLPGVIRPLLAWDTTFTPHGESASSASL